jgi:hypothetical protein
MLWPFFQRNIFDVDSENSYEKSFGTLYTKDRIFFSMGKTAYILDLTLQKVIILDVGPVWLTLNQFKVV